MATISDADATQVRHGLHEFAYDLLQNESPHLTKVQIKAALQAIEDWYEGERVTVKLAMDAAVGQTLSIGLAKKIGKFWMKRKWGLE